MVDGNRWRPWNAGKEKVVQEVKNYRITKYEVGEANGDYFKLYAPSWNNNWKSDVYQFTEEEESSYDQFLNTDF